MDYTIFYKDSFSGDDLFRLEKYDLFVSAFDDCERTKTIFDSIDAKQKVWIDFPHYALNPTGDEIYRCESFKEDECFIPFFENQKIDTTGNICVDATGFLRPHLIFFLTALYRFGIKQIDLLYTEPNYYRHAEDTSFSGFIDEVRLIEGCGSQLYFSNTENDILISTAGYDDKLVAKVSQYKSKIKNKYYIFGFPSLQADMYQESILKLYHAKESVGMRMDRFAPAHDPFVTAQVIETIVDGLPTDSNIYLSPLSTKPQTLGIALYYLWNFERRSVNIIFPFSNKYFPKTATGVKKTWRYRFELP